MIAQRVLIQPLSGVVFQTFLVSVPSHCCHRVAGGELFERVIDEDFELTEVACIKYMRQICAGVRYMHDSNVSLSDILPQPLSTSPSFHACPSIRLVPNIDLFMNQQKDLPV